MTSEADILRSIRLAIGGRDDVVIWRNSAGLAEHTDRQGRRTKVPYGLCKGAADLIGIIKPSGRFLAIEVKTSTGKLRPEQKNFLRLIKSLGGVAGVARSVAEANAIVNIGKASAELAGDELAVLEYVKNRLVEGKRVYGQLEVAKDPRKWDQELAQELADALVYIACKNVIETE